MTEVIATSASRRNSPDCGRVHDQRRKRQFASCIRWRTLRNGPAEKGTNITLAPGTYRGFITINKGCQRRAPVVGRVEEPDAVTLTSATRLDFKREFANVEGDLYRAPIRWQVRWMMVDPDAHLAPTGATRRLLVEKVLPIGRISL